ncbi:hypothetical protein [Proteiniclasticum sp. QWL-01]|uniref:hypothetical protein n=1 Tax=Proteiniclasticum sp. QWL-01 TaxID=3036945 RepID=UPI00240FA88A|nr:hypothetical protein [Proteiniclasticum sp. QWL-01]WFF72999.1 hypothetical protein P6M73_00600 [Proteiniclasticum sp. QWL-01]
MNNLEVIQNQINDIITAATSAAEDLQTKIDKATLDRGAATAAMLTAQGKGNPKDYSKAASEVRTIGDILELYATQKAQLDAKPLISAETYETMVNNIMVELDQMTANAKADAAKHLEALRDIRQETLDNINFGNSLLHQVQHDLFKDPAEMITANGNRVHIEAMEKQYKDYALPAAIDRAIDTMSHLYQEGK